MHTLCRWAISCPAANDARLRCECALFELSDDEKAFAQTENIPESGGTGGGGAMAGKEDGEGEGEI